MKQRLTERVIKTLKSKILRYLTHKQTHIWIDVLQPITNSYNSTYHQSIQCSPVSVTKEKEAVLWFKQYNTQTN